MILKWKWEIKKSGSRWAMNGSEQMWFYHYRKWVHFSNCECLCSCFQMISQSLKARSCCRKAWSRSRSSLPRRSGRRADAGGSFVSESRSTGWTWRPSSLTRGSSAMGVSGTAQMCFMTHTHLTSSFFKRYAAVYLCALQREATRSVNEWKSVFILKHQFVTLGFFDAGYYGDGLNAIIVFAVCFMPESNQPNYRYIMDNLFK